MHFLREKIHSFHLILNSCIQRDYSSPSYRIFTFHSALILHDSPFRHILDRLQSMGLLRVGHDWATSPSLFTFMHWRRKWQPAPVFLPGKSQGRWSLMGCRHGVTQSRTRLKQLGSSSSSTTRELYFISCLVYLDFKLVNIISPNNNIRRWSEYC